jgi:hypothetical protein
MAWPNILEEASLSFIVGVKLFMSILEASDGNIPPLRGKCFLYDIAIYKNQFLIYKMYPQQPGAPGHYPQHPEQPGGYPPHGGAPGGYPGGYPVAPGHNPYGYREQNWTGYQIQTYPMGTIGKEDLKKNMEKIFNQVDSNQNGFIEMHEVPNLIALLYQACGTSVPELRDVHVFYSCNFGYLILK